MGSVYLVAGLSFGDEGKGSTIDYLTHRLGAHTVVRYNGGAQCAHNVVTPDGKHHTFAQFGSGTFLGARTHLSRHVLVDPLAMRNEARALHKASGYDPYELLTVERSARVITPYHILTNRVRESLRGDDRHGSCGMGIGETVQDSLSYPEMTLRIEDLQDPVVLRKKLSFIRDVKFTSFGAAIDVLSVDEWVSRYFEAGARIKIVDHGYLAREILSRPEPVLFEGGQGVLLDQDYGFAPYNTWTDITYTNALELLEGFQGDVTRVGILRGYTTRHGAGPFPTESKEGPFQPDSHNVENTFQGSFRLGYFDLVMARYANEVIGGVDELVLTNLDRSFEADGSTQVCVSYNIGPRIHVQDPPVDLKRQEALTKCLFLAKPDYQKVESAYALVRLLETTLQCKIPFCSWGPTRNDKQRMMYV